MRNGDFTMM